MGREGERLSSFRSKKERRKSKITPGRIFKSSFLNSFLSPISACSFSSDMSRDKREEIVVGWCRLMAVFKLHRKQPESIVTECRSPSAACTVQLRLRDLGGWFHKMIGICNILCCVAALQCIEH